MNQGLTFCHFPQLLRGAPGITAEWIEQWRLSRVLGFLGVICIGAGLFGATMGIWRSEQQSLYTALKFPLIIVLTTMGNGLLNGMLATLLGLNLGFRQTLMAILLSFTIAALILGSLSPVLLFFVWNTPSLAAQLRGEAAAFEFVQLSSVLAIAFAGAAGNILLFQALRRLSASNRIAWRVLLSWLGGNLFLGAQLAWILRPFIGAPHLPVEFLRPDAFEGNFYETLLGSISRLLGSS